jgi:hypothetical protein
LDNCLIMAIEINGDTGISGVNGSATTPAIQGTDTNTGISFGTDTVNLVTGGSNRATVDSNGDFSVNTDSLFVDASADRVGIGLSNPSAPLDIQANSGAEAVYIRAHSSPEVGQMLFRNNANSSTFFRISAESGGTELNAIGSAYLTAVTNGTERMRITSDGRVGVNATNFANGRLITESDGSAVTPFVVRDTASGTGSVNSVGFFRSTTQVGSIALTGSATAYNTSSDYRLKENIVPLTGAADRLNQLQVHRFNFIAEPDRTVDGFLAHEAQSVVPEAVTGTHNEVEVWKEGEELPDGVSVGDNKLDEDGNTIPVYQGIDQSKLVPLLTAALQEALAKIETLETRLTALEGGAA